ncbi:MULTISPECIES: hypothetical protein [unclassified Streptomyces]|uniref:hypothetical protein n=1 Tax=unclassified Streptomyces TaxID=2593676 RepID=UPI002DD8F3F9|nr:hypothetical protein [Streptomyces sp. NBC_01445]WSE11511.1 hypothetical protein OG574_50940 [Streptomyces sp. NBC_01445]
MPEYTISTQSGSDWPDMPAGGLSSYLLPKSLQCKILDDSDVLVFRAGKATVSVSWELAGTWYVDIEGCESSGSADLIAAEIAQQLGDATGEQAVHCKVTD